MNVLSVLRKLTAFLLAFAVLAPACCCMAKPAVQKVKAADHSCCGKENKAPEKKESCKDCALTVQKKNAEEHKTISFRLLEACLQLPVLFATEVVSFLPAVSSQAPARTISLSSHPPSVGLVVLYHFFRC